MTVAVAPSLVKVGLSYFKTLQRIFHLLIYRSGMSVEIEQILRAIVYEPLARIAVRSTVVLSFVAHHMCRAVGHVYCSAVSSTQQSLSLAVTVPVVGHDVVLIVLKVGHVRTEIYPP